MAEPKPLILAQLFTELLGRNVAFAQVLKAPISKLAQAYGVYLIKPKDTKRIIKLDLALLGSFGGALLGLPLAAVKERLALPELDEPLRDASHEVLNIAASVVSLENRAVFETMFIGTQALPKILVDSLVSPAYRSYFNVTVEGYEGGAFSLLAPI